MMKIEYGEYQEMIEKGLSERKRIEETVKEIVDKGVENVFLLGCGGSLAVMFPLQYIIEQYSTIPVYTYNASEFLAIKPKAFSKESLVITSSYSGTTPETVKVAEYAKRVGAPIIGFTGDAESPLGKAVDYCFANNANTGVTDSKIIMLYQIIFNLLKYKVEFPEYEEIMSAMKHLPEALVKVKEQAEPLAKEFAEKYKDESYFMTLGAGILWGETYSYATCILEEMQWIKARSVHAGEFFHGSFEIVTKDTSLLIFKGEDHSRPLIDRVEKFVNKYAEKITVLDTKQFQLSSIPEKYKGLFSPLVISSALDRFSKNLSEARNHPLKTRRYMGVVDY